MLVHNLVVTGSLTFPTALPISGSLLVSGSVGINTASPAYALDVTGTGRFTNSVTGSNTNGIGGVFTSNTYFGSIDLQNTGGDVAGKWNVQVNSGTQVGGSAGSSFGIYSYGASAYRLFINSSGSVGIGTVNPQSIVHASKNNSTAPTSGTTPSGYALSYGTGDGDNGGIWFSSDFGGDQGIAGIAASRVSGYQTDLRFYTNNTNSARAFTERMRITAGGNVGIGTTNPDNTYQGLTIYGANPSLRLKGSGASAWLWTEYVNSSGTNNFSMGVNQSGPLFGIKAGAGLDNCNFVLNSSGNITTTALFSPTRQSIVGYTGTYGVSVVGAGNVSTYTFNLATLFPEMAVNGNVVAVYGKYVIFRGAAGESGQFGMSRATNNTWAAASFSNQTATGTYSLSSVTGTDNSLTFTFNTTIYFACEIVCMVS